MSKLTGGLTAKNLLKGAVLGLGLSFAGNYIPQLKHPLVAGGAGLLTGGLGGAIGATAGAPLLGGLLSGFTGGMGSSTSSWGN